MVCYYYVAGKRDKAKKILEKAQDFDVHQKELLKTALRNFNQGARVLVSQEDLLKYEGTSTNVLTFDSPRSFANCTRYLFV